MKKIGLFFGSFNPIHVGHMIIANFMVTQTPLDQVWFIVSPHNPHKDKKTLAKPYDRLHLVQLAIENNNHFKASDIEFSLPQPSYTIDTLTYLKEKYPKKEFVLIMGGDNLATLHKWKNYEQILKNHSIFVYKRPNYDLGELAEHPKVHLYDAPMMSISASYIRKCIQGGHSIEYLVRDVVHDYIEATNMYR